MIETKHRARDQVTTTAHAARILGVTPAGVLAMERRGKLAAQRLPSGQRLFRIGDLERLKLEREKNTPEAVAP